MAKRKIFSALIIFISICSYAQDWPKITQECKPGTRWWWLGSAVDSANLQWNIEQYAKAGIGALEITPIYGVQGNEIHNLKFLTGPWMNALKYVQTEGTRDSIEIDMNTGTGWPFGGPEVTLKESACKVEFRTWDISEGKIKINVLPENAKERPYTYLDKLMAYSETGTPINVTSYVHDSILQWKAPKGKWHLIALYVSRNLMKVKRAAPGGEGYVIDHFDSTAVSNYLSKFDKAFNINGAYFPHTFFNDSYEVEKADWTPSLLKEFYKRRGYKLEDHLPELMGEKEDIDNQVLSDYRETLSDLLIHNFTEQWTAWAHSHNSITRNQAHGSPSNLIDTYAAVDIPEIEGFGLSQFHIKGLREDESYTRKNFSDLSMLKYASSASHITGKKFTSSETFTWLTEHFRTSLSQCKPDLDLMFISGVNHVFFQGTCYSPKNDPWPGWKFYASIDISPTNSIWRDAPYFMKYITRCQSFLQWGQPDNDFIVYLPFHHMISQHTGNNLIMQFDIHSMARKAPQFIRSILNIDSLGFDCDYISDKFLMTTKYVNGMLQTAAGVRYKALIIPDSTFMPAKVKQHINSLIDAGATINYGCDNKAMQAAARPEQMKTDLHLKMIRRRNDKGYHYFISNLTPNDVNSDIELAVKFSSAMLFDPMTGKKYATDVNNGKVNINLRSGQSIILETFDEPTTIDAPALKQTFINPTEINRGWKLNFIESNPKVEQEYDINKLTTWEKLSGDSVKETMGTGSYTTTFYVPYTRSKQETQWALDLGDVRESARVWINNKFIGCAWCVPFILDCNNTINPGKNTIRIDVTNLPANRIAAMDRKGIKWRKFNDINIVDLNYKNTTYDQWEPVNSGLNSMVTLYQVK